MWVLTSLPNVNLGAGWTVELSVQKNLPSLSGAWRWSLGMSLSRFLLHQGYCWPCSENCQTVTGIIGWTAPLLLPTVSYSSYLSGATYFSYQGSVYQQVFGTAMGSPISVQNIEIYCIRNLSTLCSILETPYWQWLLFCTFHPCVPSVVASQRHWTLHPVHPWIGGGWLFALSGSSAV